MKRQNKKSLASIMIAALNEEKTIRKIVKDTLKIKNCNVEVLVIIDSKTTDNTPRIAKKAGARVIDTGKWIGKGAALRLALPHAKGKFVVQMDADYQFIPSDIPKLIDQLRNGYDVALGSRYEKGANTEEGSVTAIRHFGIFSLSLLTSIICGQRITDMPAGFKAFKTKVLKEINMETDHYGYEAEVIIKAIQKKYKVICVPICYKKRLFGNSKLIPLKDGFLLLKTILKFGLKPCFKILT